MEAFVSENVFQMTQNTSTDSRFALLSLSSLLHPRTFLGSPDLPLPLLRTDVVGDLSQRVTKFVLISHPIRFPWQPLEGVDFHLRSLRFRKDLGELFA